MKRAKMIEELALRLSLMKGLNKSGEEMAECTLLVVESHGMSPPEYYPPDDVDEDLCVDPVREWET